MSEIQVKEQELLKESTSYIEKAQALAKITDDAGLEAASSFLKTIKNFRSMVKEHYEQDVKKAHELWKSLTEKRRKADDPLDQAERIIKIGMSAYHTAQEQKRQREEQARQAEARKQAEEAKLAAAQEAENGGDHEAASAILEAPAPVIPVTVAPVVPKIAGVSYKKVWHVEVTDKLALLRAIAEGRAPIGLVDVNEGSLKKLAAALALEAPYPGVRAWQQSEVSARKNG